MKKIIFLSAVATLLLSAVSASVYVNNDKDAMDDLFRANVEVLATGEASGKYTCETQIKMGDGNTFFCGTCEWVSGSVPTFWSRSRSCNK